MEENWDYQPEQLINNNKPISIPILKKCIIEKNNSDM